MDFVDTEVEFIVLADIVLFGISLSPFGLPTLIKNASFSSPIDVASHNPPPLGPSVLVGTPLGVWL